MNYEWDTAKCDRNIRHHGVDFSLIDQFDWQTAATRQDVRSDYGEERFVSIGFIGSRLYVAVWTQRGLICRLISLRKANRKEISNYEKAT